MLLLTAVTWLAILAFGLVVAWVLGEAFSRAADSEIEMPEDDLDHHESFSCEAGSVSFFYEADIGQWSVMSSDAVGLVTGYQHFQSFDIAADSYESACDLLREDAARDGAVGL